MQRVRVNKKKLIPLHFLCVDCKQILACLHLPGVEKSIKN